MELASVDPSKLLRIGMMTFKVLAETGRGPLGPGAARYAKAIHELSLREIKNGLPVQLWEELDRLLVPISDDETTEAELRLAQAQLVGWIQGLFQGAEALISAQRLLDHPNAEVGAETGADTQRQPGAYL